MDQKMAQVNRLVADTANTGGEGGGTGPHHSCTRGRSEFKSIQLLDKHSGEARLGYRAWTRNLKNALASDFEELANTDDQWYEYFENTFGCWRGDGKMPADADRSKKDIGWILTDMLSENIWN